MTNWYQSNRSPAMTESNLWIWRKVDSLPDTISDFRGSLMHNPSGVSSDPWSYGFPEPNPPPSISPSSSYGADYGGYRDPPPPPSSPPSNYGGTPTRFPSVPFWNPWSYRDPPPNPSMSSFYQDSGNRNCSGENEREGIGVLTGYGRRERDSDYGHEERNSSSEIEEQLRVDLRELADELRRQREMIEAEQLRAYLKEIVDDLRKRREKIEAEVKASIKEASQESEESVATAMIKDLEQDSVDSATTVMESVELKVVAKATSEVAYHEEIEGRVENASYEDEAFQAEQKIIQSIPKKHMFEESTRIIQQIGNGSDPKILMATTNSKQQVFEFTKDSMGLLACSSTQQVLVEMHKKKVSCNTVENEIAHELFGKMCSLVHPLMFDPGGNKQSGSRHVLGNSVNIDVLWERFIDFRLNLVEYMEVPAAHEVFEKMPRSDVCVLTGMGYEDLCVLTGLGDGNVVWRADVGLIPMSECSHSYPLVFDPGGGRDCPGGDKVVDVSQIGKVINFGVESLPVIAELVDKQRLFAGNLVFDPGGGCVSTGVLAALMRKIQGIGTSVVTMRWGGIAVDNGLILVFDPGIPKIGGFWRHFYDSISLLWS